MAKFDFTVALESVPYPGARKKALAEHVLLFGSADRG